MPNIKIPVNHAVGLHARPAGEFVKTAASFPCEIQVRNLTEDGKFVNAKSILSVLSLGVRQGYSIEIDAQGEGAEDALSALEALVDNNFGE